MPPLKCSTRYLPLSHKAFSVTISPKIFLRPTYYTQGLIHLKPKFLLESRVLQTFIMKLGAANAKETLNVYNEIIKKPGSPQDLKALNCCVEAYKYAILSFEMVSSELVEDPQAANYDVAVIGPEIPNCEKELINAKVQAPRLLAGNRFMKYYVSMGYEITSTLELENPNEY
ncbi:hypothetical protein V6Z11_A05G262600 [Gossypium hirsutum]